MVDRTLKISEATSVFDLPNFSLPITMVVQTNSYIMDHVISLVMWGKVAATRFENLKNRCTSWNFDSSSTMAQSI